MGIADAITDIGTLLRELPGIATVRIWNNQVSYMRENKYTLIMPALLIEVVNGISWDQLGVGMLSADVGFRIHIVHEFLDDMEGNFEQDMAVFEIRDSVIQLLSAFAPSGCGDLNLTAEEQSYDHDNVYEYTLTFTANFIDSNASKYNPATTVLRDKEPPTNLTINVSKLS